MKCVQSVVGLPVPLPCSALETGILGGLVRSGGVAPAPRLGNGEAVRLAEISLEASRQQNFVQLVTKLPESLTPEERKDIIMLSGLAVGARAVPPAVVAAPVRVAAPAAAAAARAPVAAAAAHVPVAAGAARAVGAAGAARPTTASAARAIAARAQTVAVQAAVAKAAAARVASAVAAAARASSADAAVEAVEVVPPPPNAMAGQLQVPLTTPLQVVAELDAGGGKIVPI